MKRIIVSTIFAILSIGSYAQDMIVKKDGSIIQAKVSEIGTSEVKYTKWSNQDGPSYAIAKSDILAITYQNGEKETFDDAIPQSTTAENAVGTTTPLTASTNNSDEINKINNAHLSVNDSKLVSKHKIAKLIGVQLGIAENSVIQSDVMSVSFIFGRTTNFSKNAPEKFTTYMHMLTEKDKKGKPHPVFAVWGTPVVEVQLRNKTEHTLFIDLANSFFSKGEVSVPYYIPTATTTSSTSTSGGAFNLGGLTNGLGIGGLVGSLANATTIGGSSGTTSSNVVYSQRVVSIPPHSTISIPYKSIEDGKFITKFYASNWRCYATEIISGKQLYIGEEIMYSESDSPMNIRFFTTVSTSENFSKSKTCSVSLYVKKIVGIDTAVGSKLNVNGTNMDFSEYGLYTFGRCRY